MKSRKFIAVITFFAGLPGLASPLLFFEPSIRISTLVLGLLAFFLRGSAGVAGSIGLWRGKVWGYKMGLIAWLYLVLASVFNLYQVFFNEAMQFQFLLNEGLKMSVIGKSLGKLLWGIPILVILGIDLWRARERKQENESDTGFKFQKLLKNRTVLFIILGILLVGIVVTTWKMLSRSAAQSGERVPMQYSQEMEERVANWKTYKNEEYGITFKYPPVFEPVGDEDDLSGIEMFGLKTIASLVVPTSEKDNEIGHVSVILDTDSAKQAATTMAKLADLEVTTMTIRNRLFYKTGSSYENAQFDTDFPSRKYKSLSIGVLLDENILGVALSNQEIVETILYSLEINP